MTSYLPPTLETSEDVERRVRLERARAETASEIRHGKWVIYFDPPPIPVRTMDWCFIHEDYDASWEGEEDGWVSNGLAGHAESIEACVREIAEIEEERGMTLTGAA